MKKFLKVFLNKIIDLIFLPFEFLINFVKNPDTIILRLVRFLLLLVLFVFIVYIFISKPYNKFLKGFRIQKYTDEKIAKTELLKILPTQTTELNTYKIALNKNGFLCKEGKDVKGLYNNCISYDNRLYKKYEWNIFMRINSTKNDRVSLINITIKQVDNSFKTLYKKILKK